MSVVPLRLVRKHAPEPVRAEITEHVLLDAVRDGVLHAATLELGWYDFQGGHVAPPAQWERWRVLRCAEFEARVFALLAEDVLGGRALSSEDVERVKLGASRIAAARDELLRVMHSLGKGAEHR